MPAIKRLSRALDRVPKKNLNWFPGHMLAGMKAMIGKLQTVDCVLEVHDARIPFTGRNKEFKRHLGLIKPRILVLNKMDLADLSRWDDIKERLIQQDDKDVVLTDLSGSQFSAGTSSYNDLIKRVVQTINESDRYNRATMDHFKLMVVGIPNVGKSTLVNRLRQHHMGRKGEATKTGGEAGVTRHVENMIRICWRPPIYCLDTPGVLQPASTKNKDDSMRLALCSTINDKVLNPEVLAEYLLNYLNSTQNQMYLEDFGLEAPVGKVSELHEALRFKETEDKKPEQLYQTCWLLVRRFRKGCYGKIMFD